MSVPFAPQLLINAEPHAPLVDNDQRRAITKVRRLDGGENLGQFEAKALNVEEIDGFAPLFILGEPHVVQTLALPVVVAPMSHE